MALSVTIPENILLSTRRTNKELELEAKRAIAQKFYVDKKISLGQGAELAEMTKEAFIAF